MGDFNGPFRRPFDDQQNELLTVLNRKVFLRKKFKIHMDLDGFQGIFKIFSKSRGESPAICLRHSIRRILGRRLSPHPPPYEKWNFENFWMPMKNHRNFSKSPKIKDHFSGSVGLIVATRWDQLGTPWKWYLSWPARRAELKNTNFEPIRWILKISTFFDFFPFLTRRSPGLKKGLQAL